MIYDVTSIPPRVPRTPRDFLHHAPTLGPVSAVGRSVGVCPASPSHYVCLLHPALAVGFLHPYLLIIRFLNQWYCLDSLFPTAYFVTARLLALRLIAL